MEKHRRTHGKNMEKTCENLAKSQKYGTSVEEHCFQSIGVSIQNHGRNSKRFPGTRVRQVGVMDPSISMAIHWQ